MTKTALKPEGMSGVGPYSIAIKSGGVVYLSGQVHMDPESGKLTIVDFKTDRVDDEQAIADLNQAWLSERAGITIDDVVFMDATHMELVFGLFWV